MVSVPRGIPSFAFVALVYSKRFHLDVVEAGHIPAILPISSLRIGEPNGPVNLKIRIVVFKCDLVKEDVVCFVLRTSKDEQSASQAGRLPHIGRICHGDPPYRQYYSYGPKFGPRFRMRCWCVC